MGKASLGVNFLFGYTQVHPVCFRIIINTLFESNIQIPAPGLRQPHTPLWVSQEGEVLLHGTQCLLVQAINGHNKAPRGEDCMGGRRGVFKTSLEAVGTTGERSRLSSEISPGSLEVQIRSPS